MNGRTVHVAAAVLVKEQIYLNTISLNTKNIRSDILGILHKAGESLMKDIKKIFLLFFYFGNKYHIQLC